MHLPFCVAKCRYCDFNSYAWKDQDLARHVDAVLAEARVIAADLRPQTVFVGGGTPTFLPPDLLARFLAELDVITGFRASAREVTMEANPESCDAARMQAAQAGGVNRISIGVQSLRPEILQAYDRVHGPEQALAAYANARAAGIGRVNLDLIYAFPGQEPGAWHQDLDRVLGLEPDHVSCYELAYEPGTSLTRLRDAGRWREEDPDICRALFDTTGERCAAAGYGRYEISNFARPGEACLHNMAYWRSLEWVGIGAGAASWRHGERRKNTLRPDAYEAAVFEGRDPVGERRRPDADEVLFDHFLMGLRLPAEGVRLARAEAASGLDPCEVWAAEFAALQAEGLLELARDPEGEACVRATSEGLIWLDSILERLLPDAPQ
ncbi:MAG TPA: radical SAM family heme chaperone HemW [Planctomycetota bacterium]